MEAGKELDALIAEKVMGLCVWREPPFDDQPVIVDEDTNILGPLLPYSTDISTAWLVVGRMRSLGYRMLLTDELPGTTKRCMFVGYGHGAGVAAETDELAICLASLQTVRGRRDQS